MFIELTTYPSGKKLLVETTGMMIQPSTNAACPKGCMVIPQGHAGQLVKETYDQIRNRLCGDVIGFEEKPNVDPI